MKSMVMQMIILDRVEIIELKKKLSIFEGKFIASIKGVLRLTISVKGLAIREKNMDDRYGSRGMEVSE